MILSLRTFIIKPVRIEIKDMLSGSGKAALKQNRPPSMGTLK